MTAMLVSHKQQCMDEKRRSLACCMRVAESVECRSSTVQCP